jgi:hypothetical protein
MRAVFVVLTSPPNRTTYPTFMTVFVVIIKHRLTVRDKYVLRGFENELLRRKVKAVVKTVLTCDEM